MIVDVHGHTLDLAYEAKAPLAGDLGGLTDIPLLRAGGVAAQLTACWVPDAAIGGPHGSPEPLRKALTMIDYLLGQLDGASGLHVMLALRADDVIGAQTAGKIALILGFEGSDALKGDLGLLRAFHRLGVRHLGLVHEGRNAVGTATQVWEGAHMRLYNSQIDPPGGLTDAGKAFIQEMNQLGLLVDVTHMEEKTFWDTLEVAESPVVATHGNARYLQDTVRNLTDDQIRAIAQTGGLICPSPTPLGPGSDEPSLELLLDNMDHMVELVGPEHVGFGSDFLGQIKNRPDGLEDVSKCGNIEEGLRHRHHDEKTVEKLSGLNFMRVFAQVAG